MSGTSQRSSGVTHQGGDCDPLHIAGVEVSALIMPRDHVSVVGPDHRTGER